MLLIIWLPPDTTGRRERKKGGRLLLEFTIAVL
jgi:hypothetical protein